MMFDLDNFSWDVDKKADKLNASLFGSADSDKKKKKIRRPKPERGPKPVREPREKKPKKVKPSSIIHDSDDETFTKKDLKKLKERKRKSKKASEENGKETTNEDVLLFSQASEIIAENGIDTEIKPKSKKKTNVSFQDDSDVEDKPKEKKRKKSSITENEPNSNGIGKSIIKKKTIENSDTVSTEISSTKRKMLDSENTHQTDNSHPVKKQKINKLDESTVDSPNKTKKKKKDKANQSISEKTESQLDADDVDMTSLFDRRKGDWLNDAQSNMNSLLAIEQSIKASKDEKKANDLIPVVIKPSKKKKKKSIVILKEQMPLVNAVQKTDTNSSPVKKKSIVILKAEMPLVNAVQKTDTNSSPVKNNSISVKVNTAKDKKKVNLSISSEVEDLIKVNNISKTKEKPNMKEKVKETKNQTLSKKSNVNGDVETKLQTEETTKKTKNKKTKDKTPEVKSKENGTVKTKSQKVEDTEAKTPTKATGNSPQQKSQKLKDSKKANILSKMLNESASSAALDEMIESSKDKQAKSKMLQPTSDYHMDDPDAEPRSTLPFIPVLASVWGKSAILSQHAKVRLDSARFRHLNEQMYTCKGSDAFKMFKSDRQAYDVYHEGYRNQVAKWEVNPLDVIIKQLKTKPDSLIVADFGCGEAKLAESVEQTVHSFDLVALNSRVTACEMSRVPLENGTVDTAVFCLSLMGTNLTEYVREAGRVLKDGGILKIAEVTSRFHAPSAFITAVTAQGFQLLNKRDLTHMFYLMDFKKVKTVKKYPTAAAAQITLKPCLYKRR